MLSLKNITSEENKGLLTDLLINHYREIIGPDWAEKIPIKKLRDNLSFAHQTAKRDVEEILSVTENYFNTVAFAITDNETGNYLGIALLDTMNMNNSGDEIEPYGQLYQLYIRPQYRKYFLSEGSNQFALELKAALDNYYQTYGIDEVIMHIPKTLNYLVPLSSRLGYEKTGENSSQIKTIHRINNN